MDTQKNVETAQEEDSQTVYAQIVVVPTAVIKWKCRCGQELMGGGNSAQVLESRGEIETHCPQCGCKTKILRGTMVAPTQGPNRQQRKKIELVK
jgi:hypothetical protein